MPLDSMNWSPPPTTETDASTALLIRARSYIERGWCRGELAQDRKRQPVHPASERAVRWCSSGALMAAGAALGMSSSSAFDRLEAVIGGEGICSFNNRQKTVKPVLAAFDRAIGEPAVRVAEGPSS